MKKHHPAARLVPVTSTTTAAEKAAASKSAAALASPGAAKIYGLDVLETPGRGSEVNVTNFFTIARQPAASASADRTAFIAALKNTCGSLHAFIGPLRGRKSASPALSLVRSPASRRPMFFTSRSRGTLRVPKFAARWNSPTARPARSKTSGASPWVADSAPDLSNQPPFAKNHHDSDPSQNIRHPVPHPSRRLARLRAGGHDHC
ncbi:MAG: prephenate dehydratase domain-containing protein [Spartobacteria bacterium]